MYRLLSNIRAIDLTDERGYLCGSMLGQLGIEVVKVEKPGGDSGRKIAPFYHDILDSQKSLLWYSYNTNKKGITLDIEKSDGREIFKKLVKTSDFVIESFDVGYLENLGLGYNELSEVNKDIILVSISPFGHTGPYKNYKASGLVASAMGGMMYVTGEPDRPPVRVSFDQSYVLGSSHAAVGAMIAHYYRESTGKGQWVDTSVQGSWVTTFVNMMASYEIDNLIVRRNGSTRTNARYAARLIYPCKDGLITFMLQLGHVGAKRNASLVDWMNEEGMADDYIKNIDWALLDRNTATQEDIDAIEQRIERFFETHTKSELIEGFLRRGIMGLPVSTFADLYNNPQLKDRNFWQDISYPELEDTLIHPGAPVVLPGMQWHVDKRAPLIGEHNEEIYINELGLSLKDLVNLKQLGVV